MDNSKRAKLIKIEGGEKTLMMSKARLNRDFRNINNDDQIDDYVPPSRSSR